MAESYMEMFEEVYYPPAFQKMALHTVGEFDRRQEGITGDVRSCLCRYMEGIIKLQEEKSAVPVAEVALSFLYTSLGDKDAGFRIDSYGEGGRVYGDEVLTGYMQAPWLAGYLDIMTDELKAAIAKEGLGRYIYPAGLERLKLRAVRSLLYYFSGRFRYIIADALDLRMLARVRKEKTFVIGMGEYRDWQKLIYAILPEVDVFNCDENTALDFRRFAAVHYKDKAFKGLAMENCRFTDCVFEGSEVEECRMNDCVFDGCRFDNITVRDTLMKGALFIRCDFRGSTFEKVSFLPEDGAGMEEYYEPAEFYRCGFAGGRIEGCPGFEALLKECDVEGLEILCRGAEAPGETADEDAVR